MSQQSSEADELYYGEDFGQRVDLCARIKEIILNYPEGRFACDSRNSLISDKAYVCKKWSTTWVHKRT